MPNSEIHASLDAVSRGSAAETPEEREVRLHRVRVSQQHRLAAETPEEREARLHRVRVSQQHRLAAETPEERGARLLYLYDRERYMQSSIVHSSQQPLLHQLAVRTTISKFHAGMAALQMSTCVTCMERFPGMTVRATSAGTECVRCNRDKHIPKVYSCDNNMHPGPVPQALLERFCDHLITYTLFIITSLSAGIDPGGGNAYLCCDAYHVSLQTSSWAVWVQWPVAM